MTEIGDQVKIRYMAVNANNADTYVLLASAMTPPLEAFVGALSTGELGVCLLGVGRHDVSGHDIDTHNFGAVGKTPDSYTAKYKSCNQYGLIFHAEPNRFKSVD